MGLPYNCLIESLGRSELIKFSLQRRIQNIFGNTFSRNCHFSLHTPWLPEDTKTLEYLKSQILQKRILRSQIFNIITGYYAVRQNLNHLQKNLR